MKEKSNATLRRAASLRCRTDAAIARLGRAVACYQRGAITTAELLREASAAADQAGTLELSAAELAATGSFGRSVNRKVADYRNYICTAPASPWVTNRTRSAAGRRWPLPELRRGLEIGGRRLSPTTCSGPLPAVCPARKSSPPSRPARCFEISPPDDGPAAPGRNAPSVAGSPQYLSNRGGLKNDGT